MPDDESRDGSVTVEGYDRLASGAEALERWESPWADSHYQRHYVWPAVRPRLPDVTGLDVLDAGCGVGHYAEWFAENGADVVGVDASEAALEAAQRRCGDVETFHRHDLEDPLDFAADGAFDLVFCTLVLDHVEDWKPILAEFGRVLRPDGAVVVATIHPLRRYLNRREELSGYHVTEGYVVEWGSTDAEIESYYRPVGDVVESFLSAGLSITAFREPRPQEALREQQPDRYEAAMERPDTLCVRARPTDRRSLPDD